MTNDENKFLDLLKHMTDGDITSLRKKVLCLHIKQLLVIIEKLKSQSIIRPIGPTRVLKVEDSLPQDPIIVTETKND